MIVRPAPPERYAWLSERANVVLSPGLRCIEAVSDSGRILGMVGHDGWTHNACMVHVAIDSPLAIRPLVRQGFAIPFNLGLGVVIATVLSTNTRSLRLVRGLGFREVLRARDWWAPGVDMIWHEMRREECRWIPQQQGRKAA